MSRRFGSRPRSRSGAALARRLGAALAAALLSGCVTFVHSSQGRPLSAEEAAALEPGRTTLPELLTRLGAPHEVHRHADGRLLVYRHRRKNTFRLGIQPAQALRFVDLTQVASEAASNISLTIERRHAGEDRLVVLIDDADVVQAVGFQLVTDDLPIF